MSKRFELNGNGDRVFTSWPEFRSYIDGVSSSLAYSWNLQNNFYQIVTEPLLGFTLVHNLENTASADLTDWEDNYKDLSLRFEGTNFLYPVRLATADGTSLNLTQSSPITTGSTGIIVGGKTTQGTFQFLNLDRSNRLQVSFATEAPVGTTPVFVGTSSIVPGTSTENTDYTIPSGSTLVLQRLAGGSEGQPDRTSRVDLFYYPSGTTGPGELLRNGFCSSNNFEFTLNYTFAGNGTRIIRLVRARMDGGSRQITGFWDGFLED